MIITWLQAGLIVKLLMKLSGQMTPNDKGVTDKYTYGWKQFKKPQLPKTHWRFFLSTHSTLDEEQSWLLHTPCFAYQYISLFCIMYFCESHILIVCKYVYLKFGLNKLIYVLQFDLYILNHIAFLLTKWMRGAAVFYQ